MALAFSCRRNARSCVLQLLHCIDSSTISPSLEAPKRPSDTLQESCRVIGGTPSSLSFAASFAKGGREGRAGVHGFQYASSANVLHMPADTQSCSPPQQAHPHPSHPLTSLPVVLIPSHSQHRTKTLPLVGLRWSLMLLPPRGGECALHG